MTESQVLAELIAAFHASGIRYAIGGSVASSAVGLPRATLDTDILVEIDQTTIERLGKYLAAAWFFDVEFALASINANRPFNIIHIPLGLKFDLFPAHSNFHREELSRAMSRDVRFSQGSVDCKIVSPEDMILAKLRWYRDGGESSERQWQDAAGIADVNKTLDLDYLRRWALSLGISDLLDRLLR